MNLSRRNLLLGAVQGTGLMMLYGCEKAFNSLQQNKQIPRAAGIGGGCESTPATIGDR